MTTSTEKTLNRYKLARRTLPPRYSAATARCEIKCGSQGDLVTHLRKMMLEELQRRNYSKLTIKAYLRTVWELSLIHI